MRGPYLITALPEDLSGLDTELIAELHRIVLARGRRLPGDLACLAAMTPEPVFIAASTRPDHLRLNIRRQQAQVVDGRSLAMIFLTADGINYVLLLMDVRVEELRSIVNDHRGP